MTDRDEAAVEAAEPWLLAELEHRRAGGTPRMTALSTAELEGIAALRAEISALALRCVELVEVKARLAEVEAERDAAVLVLRARLDPSNSVVRGQAHQAAAALQAAPAAGQDGEVDRG